MQAIIQAALEQVTRRTESCVKAYQKAKAASDDKTMAYWKAQVKVADNLHAKICRRYNIYGGT